MTFERRLQAAEFAVHGGPIYVLVDETEPVNDDGDYDPDGEIDTKERALARYCRKHGLTEPPPEPLINYIRLQYDDTPLPEGVEVREDPETGAPIYFKP